jgi:tetratricopeptide (TPR) repeat protein
VSTEYTALGDAVNVAARVQSAAEPGQILLADATARLVEGAVELEPLGSFEVKGRSAPVRMHRVIGLRKAASTPGHRRPLVGRDEELGALEAAAAAVREGEGRVVTLVAEAGLGKTRLIDELRVREPDLQWYEARARSYGGSTPFLIFRDHLLAWCGAREGDPPDALRAKLAAAVAEVLPADADVAMPVVELVAGIAQGDAPAPAGEEMRKAIVRVITELARRQSAKGPMVIAFDDLQWSDAASADLVAELLALTDEAPVLMLLAFRPDRSSPAWRVRQRIETDYHHRQTDVELGPLAPGEAGRLFDELTAETAVAARLRSAVLEKAEGNPLYVEQFARAVTQGEVGGDVALPDTLVSLLASRLDRLEERPRRVLQAASVIGRTFAQPLLRVIAEADGALDRDLVELQRADLIREDQRVPERVYSFRHALLQEVAYASLLQRRRRELHASVAETLERGTGDRPDDVSALIGHHWAEAGDARAIPHLRAAARRALRLHALEDALELCDSAIAIARKVGGDTSDLCDVYSDRGRALELRADYDDALATYDEMERIGKERGDDRMELRAVGHRTTVLATPTARQDLAKARDLIEAALPRARSLGDRELVARLQWNAMHAYVWSNRFEEATTAGTESLAIARELGLKELEAYAGLDLSRFQRFKVGWRDSLDVMRRSADLFQEAGNLPMRTDALATLAVGFVCLGRYDDALRTGAEALALAERIDNLWNRSFSRFATPLVHFDRGDWGAAIGEWEDAIRLGKEAGFVPVQIGPAADLAWAYHCAGADARAEERMATVDAVLAGRGDPGFSVWVDAVRGRILVEHGEYEAAAQKLAHLDLGAIFAVLPTATTAVPYVLAAAARARGDIAGALEIIRRGLQRINDLAYVPTLDDLLWLEGEVHRSAGDAAAARDAFARSLAVSDRLGAIRMRWRTLASLAALADEAGDRAEAERLRDEAAAILRRIEASLRPLGLAEGFAAMPEVKALLGRVVAT